ncbi:MAG TPA: type II secretion system protein [Pyrinomonadaceae bacterium]|jgi:general secretion pathway protein G|nr:type II secretion system protein [Pyrinomonadaceae bacterium]
MFLVREKKKAGSGRGGFSLFELIMTLAVLAVMVLAAIPLLQNTVKRQKEQALRDTLREVRAAIDEFKRDTVGSCPAGNIAGQNNFQVNGGGSFDPRSRVVVDDCKLFTVDNLDRYPPTLDDLVNGVSVRSRTPSAIGGVGGDQFTKSAFDGPNATEIGENKELIKKYLRKLPVDPMTGKSDWEIRSSFQEKDASSWDKVNVFDIRSSSDGEAMNGDKYSDW